MSEILRNSTAPRRRSPEGEEAQTCKTYNLSISGNRLKASVLNHPRDHPRKGTEHNRQTYRAVSRCVEVLRCIPCKANTPIDRTASLRYLADGMRALMDRLDGGHVGDLVLSDTLVHIV
jgi:hypothetical protein